jgi:hypothetical protein
VIPHAVNDGTEAQQRAVLGWRDAALDLNVFKDAKQ